MKKALPKAIALATSLGLAAAANAVNVNPDGLGQVLLYPVYTTENGNITAVHVTNTTDQIKAVKVRFVEGMNSQEVLDFNLYLSPFDVWTGGVVITGNGAKLTTEDTSCTKGKVTAAGIEFRNLQYQTDGAAFRGTDRTRVGHLEIIEMGEVDPTTVLATDVTAAQAIVHTAAGVPGNCGAIDTAFAAGGIWNGAGVSAGISLPAGGLYGTATIINVDAGTEIGYDAVAIDNFADTPLHTAPGSLLPSLAGGVDIASFPDGTVAQFTTGIDALSAVLSKSAIQNDYAVGAGLNAQTDFVVTFPTKRFYVNGTFGPDGSAPVGPGVGISDVLAPFTKGWNRRTAEACEPVAINYYDREEATQIIEEGDFSPLPEADEIALCHETNLVGISGSNVIGGQYVRNDIDLAESFETGWINIDFNSAVLDIADRQLVGEDIDGNDVVVTGLPTIGFAVTAIQNGDVGGLLSNYAGSWNHKATTDVEVAAP